MNRFTHVQYPPIWPSFSTSILYRIGSFLWSKSVKLIITFLALQNLMCSEHSRDESSCDGKYIKPCRNSCLSVNLHGTYHEQRFAEDQHFFPLVAHVAEIALSVKRLYLCFFRCHPSSVITWTLRNGKSIFGFAIRLVTPTSFGIKAILSFFKKNSSLISAFRGLRSSTILSACKIPDDFTAIAHAFLRAMRKEKKRKKNHE